VNVTWPASTNLGPEKAKVWTAGIDWQHLDTFGGTTSASLTYTNTVFTNRIQGAYIYFFQDPAFFVSQPGIFPGTTRRDAAGNLTDVYLTNINIASNKSQVLDLDTKYDFTAAAQHFSVGVSVAYTPRFEEQVSANAVATNLAGTFRGPDRFRGIVRASWNSPQKVWGANVFVRASSSYSNTIPTYSILEPPAGAGSQVTEKVGGYTTVDLTGSYQYHGPGVWLDGLTITAGARNLFDKSFPFIDLDYGPVLPFDPSRVDVRGRVVFVEVGKKFH
jgi:outer membrane receptor for ferrienterochelin and colicin